MVSPRARPQFGTAEPTRGSWPRKTELSAKSRVWSTWSEGRVFDVEDGRFDTGRMDLEPGALVGIEVRAPGYAPRPAHRPQTKFEQRGLRLGHGVWDLVFRRRPTSGQPRSLEAEDDRQDQFT